MHLLARLQRIRSVWRSPYEDSDRKTLMKTSFHAFSRLNLRMAELLQEITHRKPPVCFLSDHE